MNFSENFTILSIDFATDFQNKLINLFKPRYNITYWTFYAVLERYAVYETIFDEVCESYNLTDSFLFKNDLTGHEKDDFVYNLTSKIISLLDIPEGEESDYMEKF